MITPHRIIHTLMRLFCLTLVFTLFTGVVMAQDDPSEVDREYLEPVKIELTVAPGKSLSKQISVPVKAILSDGTEYIEYETVALSLTSVIVGTGSTDLTGTININSDLYDSPASLTYLYCQGSLNGSAGNYTSRVDWHYDGTTAWHDSNSVVTWTANSPWSNYRYYAAAGAPGSNVTVGTAVAFKKGSVFPDYKTHQITWTLQGSGNCSAIGNIYDGVPDW